ncbi:MAG: mannose-1-phosphate guanylyltransferase/mannose-6-phosphate isomerase [Alphaproteobacteria bacterium]|nr:mannose-1-phosphate guanylyltransferase/mannose-6-phosphate isomerase [Alphaproteobacteria bacterium]
MNELIHPVILSGGSGTRLWPMSRANHPKQFMPIAGEKSLLQETALRVADPSRFAPVTLVANDAHRFTIADQLASEGVAWRDLILEPVGRNTAPAVLAAASRIAETQPDAVIAVLASDHAITDVPAFHALLETARRAASTGALVTFGMAPTRPATGYGYIKQGGPSDLGSGVFALERFVEKPDAARAAAMLEEGGYLWNSGMFVFQASAILAEAERYCPAILAAARKSVAEATRDLDFLRLAETAFAASPSESIDTAIMEKTDRALVAPGEIGWSDVGAWSALSSLAEPDANGNVAVGPVVSIDTKNSYLRSTDGKVLATIGLDAVTVVATDDAVLVAASDRSAQVKDIVALLKSQDAPQADTHRKVYRPWGSYEDIDQADGFRVKRIIVNPGAKLSLQRHRHRSEHWVVVRGVGIVTCGDATITLNENESTFIPVQATHRLENPGETPLHLIEVQVGSYVGEDDIERLEDTYGRV